MICFRVRTLFSGGDLAEDFDELAREVGYFGKVDQGLSENSGNDVCGGPDNRDAEQLDSCHDGLLVHFQENLKYVFIVLEDCDGARLGCLWVRVCGEVSRNRGLGVIKFEIIGLSIGNEEENFGFLFALAHFPDHVSGDITRTPYAAPTGRHRGVSPCGLV